MRLPTKCDGTLTERHRLFCRYYAIHGNASRAAREVGANPKHANGVGYQMLTLPHVQAEIKRINIERCGRLTIQADQIIEQAAAIALHDATKISQMRNVPCGACWEHWLRDLHLAEIDAKELAEITGEPYEDPEPEDVHPPDRPDPKCQRCHGAGRNEVWFEDSRNLDKRERLAFVGASITKDGHKVDIADRLRALDILAKLLGLYKDSGEDKREPVNVYFNGMRFPPEPPNKDAKP